MLREFRRVLRPRGALVIETMHRDRLARIFVARAWDRLPDDALFLQEHEADWIAGELSVLHLIVTRSGERVERRYVHRVYAATEWASMLREAGCEEVEVFADWEGMLPPSPERRLIVRARRAVE